MMQAQMIKAYVDQTFDKYDKDKSGTLDEEELTYFFNDLFKLLGMNVTVTRQQSLEAIKSIDQNSDGSVDKQELFDAFMKMVNTPPPAQQMTQSYPQSYPQYPGNYQSTNMSMSYSGPRQYTPPNGYNGYYQAPHNEYGIENPYMNSPYYPPTTYNPPYQQYTPPQYQSSHQPYYPPQYQAPYQPPYPGYQGGYPQQPPYGQNPNLGNKSNFMPKK